MTKTNLEANASDFIARNPVFRFEEFAAALKSRARSPATIKALLRYHVGTGRLWNLRRGLYVSAGNPDPFVIASRMTPDAVLAYDGALAFHGYVSEEHQLCFLTAHQTKPLVFGEIEYRPVKPPRVFGTTWRDEVLEVERAGQNIRVTSLERTLVDMLDRLDLMRDQEKLSRNLDTIRAAFLNRHLDGEAIVRYARSLSNGIVAARVGVFLEHMPYMRPRDVFDLIKDIPRSPAYFDRTQRSNDQMIFLRTWNLMVPKKLALDLRDARPIPSRLRTLFGID